MHVRPKNLTLTVLLASTLAILPVWSDLSNKGRLLENQYEKQLKDLRKGLESDLPTPDQRQKSSYLKAREAETEALKILSQAQERSSKLGKAQGLVKHAKGKWIADAEKGIAQAKKDLKQASSASARQAAEKTLANWEKNKQEGLKALEERQKMLDEAERDRPKAQKALEDAKKELAEAKENTMQAIEDLGLAQMLSDNRFDGRLARFVVLNEASPKRLAEFAQQGSEQERLIEEMLGDEKLLVQMAVADGANKGKYGEAMEIYHSILEASSKAREGTLQRLALAIALEHAEPVSQRNAAADTESPATVDPLGRYLQYEQAFLNDQLDPAFANLSAWDMRMVVDGSEPDAILVWGRRMLRNYRPDHITTDDYRWRYVALVRSDIRYGSQDNQYDEPELQFFQNILKNGGVCGRRAFIGRFILRAFGIPTTARPQRGHAALAHWTPKGWVVCLGAGWGHGWTKTAYKDDLDFLATTQARATGEHYKRVKRAHWIADLMGEKRVWGFKDREEPGFWNGLALYTQSAIIEAADSETLAAVGEDIGEANVTKEKIDLVQVEITDEDRKIRIEDDVIRIPAAATSEPTGNSRGIIFMQSVLGGKQLHYGRNAGSPEFEYTFQCRNQGKYALVAKVATPSWQQNLMVTVNGADEPLTMPMPHTVGLWEITNPIEVDLKNGRNVLRFKRHSDGQSKGISIKEFTLIPWDRHSEWLAKARATAQPGEPEEPRSMSPAYRKQLELALLRALADVNAELQLHEMWVNLTVVRSKVRLAEAKGSGMLSFKSSGDHGAYVALEDLALEDHALLARLVVQIRPDDPVANAIAGAYMEAVGEDDLAAEHRSKAGLDAVEKLSQQLSFGQ